MLLREFPLPRRYWQQRLLLSAWAAVSCLAAIASAEEPPPAPADMQAMLDAGDVEIVFYDPVKNPRKFLGETKYDYFFRHSFQAEYEPVRVGNRTTAARIRLSKISVTATHKHKIFLPESRRGPRLWSDTLTRHEFDHVSLSIDPRIEALLQAVFQQVSQVKVPLPAGQELTGAWINQEVDKLLSARGQSVYAIVSYNNKQLDQLTEHGTKPIADRAIYFERLYTKENLDVAGFAHTGEVLELLKTESYRSLQPRYLLEAK